MNGATSVIFDFYAKTRIVSLPERRDRRREMLDELSKIGVADHPRISFFDAYRVSDAGLFRSAGSHGCYLSHLRILRDAAKADESVLILQDDCDFLPAILSYELPDDCDILYGGYEASDPQDLAGSDIVGAHFMGFSRRAATVAVEYLERLLDPDFPPDPKAAVEPGFNPTIRPPIDGACVWFRRAYPELKTRFELLGCQRRSRSDITPRRFFDRTAGLKQVADLARGARRAAARIGHRG
jgi:glycosyl transferase, family 25